MRSLTNKDILEEAGKIYGLTPSQLKGRSRERKIAHPRQEAMTAIYQAGGRSYPQVGRMFGGRDHTTVMDAARKAKKRAKEDADVAAKMDALRGFIENGKAPPVFVRGGFQWKSRRGGNVGEGLWDK